MARCTYYSPLFFLSKANDWTTNEAHFALQPKTCAIQPEDISEKLSLNKIWAHVWATTEDWLESSWGIFSGVCLNTSGFSPLTFHCDQQDFQKWIWWAEQLQSVDSEAFIFNHFSHLLQRKNKSLRRSIGKQTTACANTVGNIILHRIPKHRVQ